MPLHCQVVTPASLYFSGEVEMVEVPGSEGDLGVLPQHAPLVSLLRPGIVTLHKGGNDNTRLFVAGGVAEINPEGCTILAEAVTDVTRLTRAQAQEMLLDIQRRADEAVTEADQAMTRDEMQAMQQVIQVLP